MNKGSIIIRPGRPKPKPSKKSKRPSNSSNTSSTRTLRPATTAMIDRHWNSFFRNRAQRKSVRDAGYKHQIIGRYNSKTKRFERHFKGTKDIHMSASDLKNRLEAKGYTAPISLINERKRVVQAKFKRIR